MVHTHHDYDKGTGGTGGIAGTTGTAGTTHLPLLDYGMLLWKIDFICHFGRQSFRELQKTISLIPRYLIDIKTSHCIFELHVYISFNCIKSVMRSKIALMNTKVTPTDSVDVLNQIPFEVLSNANE